MTPPNLLGIPALMAALTGLASGAAELSEDAARIAEVKASPDFKVHTVKDRVPDPSSNSWLEWLFEWLAKLDLPPWTAQAIGYLVLAFLAGLLIWLIWRNRMAFRFGRGADDGNGRSAAARVVMGMAVSPESLPSSLPDAVWELWNAGKKREALGLLYRGAISRVIHRGKVEINEADTEGDCLRRVRQAPGELVSADYFARVTRLWMGGAYAGRYPTDEEARAICDGWPYDERSGE